MIHELLTILSGFDSNLSKTSNQLYHPSEQAIIAQISQLGSINAKITALISNINTSDTSICPSGHAVAKCIEQQVLAPFRKSLVDTEKRIFSKDSSYVGGDNIMPLTQLVILTVREWQRVFQYSLPLLRTIARGKCTAKLLIETLTYDSRVTGYQDVSNLVNHCLHAAQKAWINQLNCWIIYGKLLNAQDFMIQMIDARYELNADLIPSCMSLQSAKDILIIGQSLEQTRTSGLTPSISLIKDLSYPLERSQLSLSIDKIKQSVLTKVISDNIDTETGSILIQFLRSVMLLGSQDFERAILTEKSASNDPKQAINRALNVMFEDNVDTRRLEPLFSCINISNQTPGGKFQNITFDIPVAVDLKFKWPLRLVMSHNLNAKYSQLFIFLQAISTCRYKLTNEKQEFITGFSKLRLKLLWDAIWQNIQCIIDDKFKQLEDLFSGDYEIVRKRHEMVVDEILNQSMILDDQISTTMNELMICCSNDNINDDDIIENIEKLISKISELKSLTKEQSQLVLVVESLVRKG